MAIEQINSSTKEVDSQSVHSKTSFPTLSIDWDLYGEYLVGFDLTDEEKQEAILVFWNIVVAWVDLGLGLHPVQQIDGNRCEQNCENAQFDLNAVLQFLPNTQNEFEPARKRNVNPEQGRSPR